MAQNAIITYQGVVHPWLCDNMGHMTTRHYLAMFDDGSYHFLCSLGSAPSRDMETGLGWADIRQEIEYVREMKAGALTVVRAWPVEIGSKSLTYMQEMSDAQTGEVCARVLTKTVRFDLQQRKSVALESELREAINERLIPAKSVLGDAG